MEIDKQEDCCLGISFWESWESDGKAALAIKQIYGDIEVHEVFSKDEDGIVGRFYEIDSLFDGRSISSSVVKDLATFRQIVSFFKPFSSHYYAFNCLREMILLTRMCGSWSEEHHPGKFFRDDEMPIEEYYEFFIGEKLIVNNAFSEARGIATILEEINDRDGREPEEMELSILNYYKD